MRAQWLPRRPDLPGLVLAGVIGAISVALVKVLPKSPVVSDVLLAMVIVPLRASKPAARDCARSDAWPYPVTATSRIFERVRKRRASS